MMPAHDKQAGGNSKDILPQKSTALVVNPDGIPQELKDIPQWVCWYYFWDSERWTKVPLQAKPLLSKNPKVKNADAKKPSTWASFEECLEAYRKHPPMTEALYPPDENTGLDGIGFVPTLDGVRITAVDIDHCLDENEQPNETAQDIIVTLNTYCEVSPSGRGLRLFAYGTKPKVPLSKSKKGDVEMYDGETKSGEPAGRYLTVTGQRYE